MTSGEVIKKARIKKGWSQRRLAKEIGKSYGMIAQWETGITVPTLNFAFPVANVLDISFEELSEKLNEERLLNQKDKLEKIYNTIHSGQEASDRAKAMASARATQLTKEYIYKQNGKSGYPKLIRIPILGSVPAGPLQEVLPKMRSEAEEWEYLDEDKATNPELVFGLHVVGESMIGRDINDGDVIIVDPCLQPENGDIVVAMVDNEATVKTFYKQGSILTLQSANQRIEPIVLTDKKM